jgi:hypothetical protein
MGTRRTVTLLAALSAVLVAMPGAAEPAQDGLHSQPGSAAAFSYEKPDHVATTGQASADWSTLRTRQGSTETS